MPICMCNCCKGKHSFHRNTVAKHIEEYGKYNPNVVPTTVPELQSATPSSSSAISPGNLDSNELSQDRIESFDNGQGGGEGLEQPAEDSQHELTVAQAESPLALAGQPPIASASTNAAAPALGTTVQDELELGQLQQAAQDPFTGEQLLPEDDEPVPSIIDHVQTSQAYIALIQQATLENGKLPQDVIDHLRAPSPPDKDFSNDNTLSIHNVRKAVATIAGVHLIVDNMCINSCLAFTSPFADEDECPKCSESRHVYGAQGKQSSRKQMTTILLGPQLAALRCSKEGVEPDSESSSSSSDSDSSGNDELVYNDILCGSDYLDLVQNQHITENDTMVTFSFDGAQLYRNKDSDTWLGVWIVNDYSPKLCYKQKHVLPAFVVPGPNKPKLLNSYTYRSFHHLSAIRREDEGCGIKVWDALKKATIQSRIFLHLITTDAVALTELDGRVGHHGHLGCRIGCPMPGRYKPGSGGHSYAVHSLPDDYPAKPLQSQNQTGYVNNCKATGLSKPSILSGCHPDRMLPLPKCFSINLMHLVFINAGELLIPLWHGVSKLRNKDNSFEDWPWLCLKDDKVWKAHGKLVADSKQNFPSSFHRTPHNPAEKINSGYKVTEYYLYIFGLGPGFFRPLLPPAYWKNFCQLMRGVRIVLQCSINDRQLTEAYKCFIQFVEDFEALYYKPHIGPGAYYSQFTMERAIGDYGQDIRQPSNPFGNLAKIMERHAQLNAFYAVYPDMAPSKTAARKGGDIDLKDGYAFLHPTSGIKRDIPGPHGEYLISELGPGMKKVY
ncbi:hypothetical protein NMY22_g17228 [Coprinellus aureogranulatus]|nr:hypothetical protein NMY22_g17228 [Coprinellus aureogranulatus]